MKSMKNILNIYAQKSGYSVIQGWKQSKLHIKLQYVHEKKKNLPSITSSAEIIHNLRTTSKNVKFRNKHWGTYLLIINTLKVIITK